MKIVNVQETVFPEVKIVTYGRFIDNRGFFAETYKKGDFKNNPELDFLRNFEVSQANISYSKKNVIRGLHFQWNPYMAKLIRTIQGRMIDLFLDIRKGSPTFGKIDAYDMKSNLTDSKNSLIYVPVGFAHGSVFTEDTIIEYFCDSEWNPESEASISPIAPDIDWSLCDTNLKKDFDVVVSEGSLISEKDKNGYTIEQWKNNSNSESFIY